MRLLISFIKKYHYLIAILFFAILSLVTLYKFLFSNGDFIVYRDLIWPYDLTLFSKKFINIQDLDSARRVIIWYPLASISSLLDISTLTLLKIFIFFTRIVMGLSAYIVLYKLFDTKEDISTYIFPLLGGYLFSYNAFATTYISTQVNYALAYALIPLNFYYFRESLIKRHPIYYIISSFLLTIAIALDIHYILFMLILLSSLIVFEIVFDINKMRNILKSATIVIFLSMILSSYWIFPALSIMFSGIVVQPDYVLTKDMLDTFSTPSLLEVIHLGGDWWPRIQISPPSFIHNSTFSLFLFVIPIISFSSLIIYFLKAKTNNLNQLIIFFSIVSIIAIALNKGTQEPFSSLYIYLYNFPIIGWLGRVPTKIGVLLSFSYTMLSTWAIYSMYNSKYKFYSYIVIIILIVSTFCISWPMYTGDFGGIFSGQKISNDYIKVDSWLKTQDSDFSVLFYPPHPAGGSSKTSIFPQTYMMFFNGCVFNNNTNKCGGLIPWIKYIIIDNEKTDMSSFLNKQENFESTRIGMLQVLENNFSTQFIYASYTRVFFDDLSKLKSFAAISDLKNVGLIRSNFIFNKKINLDDNSDFLIYDESTPFIGITNHIALYDHTNRHQPKEVWSKAGTNNPLHGPWNYYLEKRGIKNWQSDYGKGLVLTWATNASLDISAETEKSDEYVFLIRLFENQDGGKIKVILDGKPITIETKSQLNQFLWKDIGTFHLDKGKHKIKLENVEGFNAVNLFSLVPEREYMASKEKAIEILQDKVIIYILEAESDLHIKAEINNKFGGKASNGEVIELTKNGEVWQEVDILKEGTYRLALAGEGEFGITINNLNYILNSTILDLTYTSPMYLERGKHKLNISSLREISYLDVVWLYSTDKNETLTDLFTIDDNPAEVFNYEKIDSTKYKIKINATKPFMLSFSESYDPLWVAEAKTENGKLMQYNPVPLYSVINGFWINQTGEYTITIRYKPQYYFYIGLIISGLSFSGSISYLMWYWRKKKYNMKRLSIKEDD